MCWFVKAKDVDFKKTGWFLDYSWTESQENEFKKWMTEYLKRNKEARYEIMAYPRKNDREIKNIVNEWCAVYGWVSKSYPQKVKSY